MPLRFPRRTKERIKLRQILIERDGDVCNMCGKLFSKHNLPPTIDHIHPLKQQGTNDLDNLQLLCRYCNHIIKAERTPLQILIAHKQKKIPGSRGEYCAF